jgi:hypothetical protein
VVATVDVRPEAATIIIGKVIYLENQLLFYSAT